MILYSIIILLSFTARVLLNTFLSSLSFLYVFEISGISLVLVVVIDAIIAAIVHAVPEKKINPFAKIYQTGKKERAFYERLGVRRWKDIIPESGKYLCHFSKTNVEQPNNNEYVLKFLRETCYAEIMHIISIFFGFILLIFIPCKLTIVLPVCIVNAVLQLLPVIVQRYNRVRLISLYNFNKRKEEKSGNN